MSHTGSSSRPTVSFFDKNNTSLGELVGWVDLSVGWKWNKAATAVVVTPDIPDIFPDLAKFRTETVLAAVDDRLHWTGRVTDLQVKIDRDRGQRTMEVTMVDDWAVLQALLARQNPLGALANQGSAEFDIREGPAETVVKEILADIVTRLNLPMIIQPPPDPDPSPVVTVKARMDPLDELLPPLLEMASLGLSIHFHRKGGALPPELADMGPDAEGKWIVEVHPSRNEASLSWDEAELVKGTLELSAPGGSRLIIGGAGEGVAKVYAEAVNASLEDSLGPYRLREAYLDDTDGTKTEAALQAIQGAVSVNFEVDDGVPWWAGEDFLVGDFGGGTIGGVDFRARIGEIELNADASGVARYMPKIGNATPPPEVQVARAVAQIKADIAAEKRRR